MLRQSLGKIHHFLFSSSASEFVVNYAFAENAVGAPFGTDEPVWMEQTEAPASHFQDEIDMTLSITVDRLEVAYHR